MKKFLIIIAVQLIATCAVAQDCKIKIYYDENGNRIQRVEECTGRPAGSDNPLSVAAGTSGIRGGYQVYPNPTQNQVNIRIDADLLAKGCNLVITDMSGKVIFEQHKVSKAITTFDLGPLANGVYFAVITTGNERHTVKVVKNGGQ